MLSDTRAGEQPSRAGSARKRIEFAILAACDVQFFAGRLAILSSVLQVLIFPSPNLYWLSWIAVAPLLIALRRTQVPKALQVDAPMRLAPATAWQGFLLAYACGIFWYLGTCYWIFDTMHKYGGLAIPVARLVLIVCACTWGSITGCSDCCWRWSGQGFAAAHSGTGSVPLDCRGIGADESLGISLGAPRLRADGQSCAHPACYLDWSVRAVV